MKERKQFTKEFKEGAARHRAGADDLGCGAEFRHLAVDSVTMDQSGKERRV